MNILSRIITGSVLIVLGLVLIGVGFSFSPALIYGVPLLIIGFFILLNKNEDKIEARKDERRL
jgi:hypothetical protein